LARIYSAGDHIFCGGSLVDTGGHNAMEAARWGKPVYYGPNMHDFRDAAELLESGGAGYRVADGNELARKIVHHMHNETEYNLAGDKALAVIASQQGAARRQADIVEKLLMSGQH
jgi:3-deoxy-D-manno-octulosonic-acid transferase